MHVPDGFLDLKTCATTAALSAGALGVALRETRRRLPARQVPLLGLSAAFLFAAQMLNFPVAGGTSGHLVGAVLVSVLLGPGAGIVALTAVLLVQCLVFADGGLLTLGANVFNMGVVGSVLGYGLFRAARRLFGGRTLAATVGAAAFAAWCATVLGATACAAELAASGTAAWAVAFPAMTGVHLLIGAGEAVITALVLTAVGRAQPALLGLLPAARSALPPAAGFPAARPLPGSGAAPAAERPYRGLLAYGLLAALGLAGLLSPFASKWPDGLDRVAEDHGFAALARRWFHAPLSDYGVPGLGSAALATGLAGVVGVVFAFGLAWLLARSLRRSPDGPGAPGDPPHPVLRAR